MNKIKTTTESLPVKSVWLGENEKEKENETIRKIICEFCLNTSTHALPGIARSQSLHNRIFWSISFFSFLGLMIYFVVKSITNYFEYPTQIDINIGVEWPQYFPAFTLCNVEQFLYDKFIFSYLNYTNSLNITQTNDTTKFSRLQSKYVDFYIQYKLNRNESLEEYFYPLSAMLYKCTFNSVQCSFKNFTPFISSFYGFCYTFNAKMKFDNGKSLHLTNENGGEGRLDLGIYVHSHQYLPYRTQGVGIVGLVHGNTEVPLVDLHGIQFGSGKRHKLRYVEKRSRFLPLPYTECSDDAPQFIASLINHFNGADYDNSQVICARFCIQKYSYDKCGCVVPFRWDMRSFISPRTNETIIAPLCNLTDPCYKKSVETMMSSQWVLRNYCPDCLDECSLISFTVEVSSLSRPARWEFNEIKQFVEHSSVPLPVNWSNNWQNYIEQDYLSINVALGAIIVENNTQSAKMTLVDVLSNIGGQTGLWIGISFLSLMEFVEMLYRVCRQTIRSVCSNKFRKAI